MIRRLTMCALMTAVAVVSLGARQAHAAPKKVFRAGAYAMDVSPPFGPLLVNGGFTERSAASMPPGSLHARCLVLDDGTTQIAIAVVDSCMIPRDVCDRAKAIAAKATGLRADRILISATHTHSAPSVMDYCLGTRADRRYTDFCEVCESRRFWLS
jgi:neutral ceramidase